MFAYTGFNFADMAHPLSIKFIESIYLLLLTLILSNRYASACRRSSFSMENKIFALTGGFNRDTA